MASLSSQSSSTLLPLRVFSKRYQSMLVQLAEGEVPNSNKNVMWPNLLPLFSDVQIRIIHRILAWIRSAKSRPLLRTQYSLLMNVSKTDNNNNGLVFLPSRQKNKHLLMKAPTPTTPTNPTTTRYFPTGTPPTFGTMQWQKTIMEIQLWNIKLLIHDIQD